MDGTLSCDLAVVGAGVVGLACALAAARRGLSVVVLEREAAAVGASIRNFGFITVTGQEPGPMWARARRSVEVWREVCAAAQIPILQSGLLVAARRPEAADVLEAFLATEMGEGCRLLSPAEVAGRHPYLNAAALSGVLVSPHEVRVESREAIPRIAAWLAEAHGVRFLWGAAVRAVEPGRVTTASGTLAAARIAVCPGDDLATLFPERLAALGVTRCLLQMLRLAPPGVRLPSPVMSDLGLVRYAGYAALAGGAELRARLEAEQGRHLAEGVHLIVVQSADGSLVVGDSHRYGRSPPPFASDHVDRLILEEYAAVFAAPAPAVRERWTGTYAWAPDRTSLIEAVAPGVRLAVVTTGAGASTGFAFGEEVVEDLMNGEGG